MRKPLKSGWEELLSWPTMSPTVHNGTKGRSRREACPLPERENLRKRKPKGVTGMKQGREVASGTKRQEVAKA
jgi:hypothetical protein